MIIFFAARLTCESHDGALRIIDAAQKHALKISAACVAAGSDAQRCFFYGLGTLLSLGVRVSVLFVCLLACAPDNQKAKKCDIFYMKRRCSRRCLSGAWFCLFFYRLLFLIGNAPSHRFCSHTHTLMQANALKQMRSDYVSRRLSLRRSQQKATHTHTYTYGKQGAQITTTIPHCRGVQCSPCVCACGLYMCVYILYHSLCMRCSRESVPAA